MISFTEKEDFRSPEDLRTSEIRYRRLFEAARDGILILDAETLKITDVNPYMVEFLKYSRGEFIGKEVWEIGIFGDKEQNKAAFEKLQETGYIKYDDMELETKSSERWHVEVVCNVYQEGARQVIQCNIRDITERKRAEEALKASDEERRRLAERQSSILNALPAHVCLIDRNGNILEANDTWKRFAADNDYAGNNFGIGTNYVEVCTSAHGDCAEEAKQVAEGISAVLSGKPRNFELEYPCHSPEEKRWFRLMITRLENDESGGLVIMHVDVTKTKELEEQLRQSQKLESVGLLAGGIAHDFNNMLTAINGYSDLTLRKLEENSPLRSNIEEIKKAGQRSANLTAQLLAFSRQQMLHPVIVDVNELIGDTVKMLQRVIGEDIQLATTFASKLGRVKVDPGQFSQIIMNLAVNARDAMMGSGGKLTIETANVFLDPLYANRHLGITPGDYVLLAVCDTGAGMNLETQKHIFEPFFTTKKVGKGTGLGLATVYGIVKQSGGNIEIYSEEGSGTTFKIYLPQVAEQADAVVDIKERDNWLVTGTGTILLVEDEDMVRDLSKQVLEELGYMVIETRNGIEALEICRSGEHRFDLLLTDVVMPQMGGRELADNIREILPDLQVLFTSGYTDDAIVRHGVIEASTNFIQKPFTLDSLAKKVQELLSP